jgi:hypothetical protein
MAAASATLLSEEEKAWPCGAGMLALFPLMCCFSPLDKNQRLYSSLVPSSSAYSASSLNYWNLCWSILPTKLDYFLSII